MNKDEALKNLKLTLKKLISFNSDLKFEDVPLKDGKKLSIEDGATIDVGTAIYILDANGNQTPCEDGTYELEDGRTITVSGGSIESVSDATESPKDEASESPVSDANVANEKMDVVESPADDSTEDGDIVTRVSSIEEQIAQILEILQGMSNMQEQTMSKVKEFAESPAEESIKSKKKPSENVYSKMKNTFNSNRSEIEELKALVKKNNNNNYGTFTIGN